MDLIRIEDKEKRKLSLSLIKDKQSQNLVKSGENRLNSVTAEDREKS